MNIRHLMLTLFLSLVISVHGCISQPPEPDNSNTVLASVEVVNESN